MASIDPSLFDTYKQYKTGTAKVTTWLARKARELKICDELLPNTGEIKGTGRLKGKARATQKAAPKEEKYHVSLSAIPRIAQAIALLKGQLVPGTIIQTLEDVIAARSACNTCFEEHGSTDPLTQASNTKHQHFIGVLQETLRVLKPLRKEPSQNNGNESQGRDEGLRNLFDYLEVDDPAEWTSSSLPSNNKPAKAICTYELEPPDEDISFAIFCLLKDLTDIRHYVRQTWAEYREHRIALTTAAVTMNTAIAIFRRLNEDFLTNFPQFDDHGAIIQYLYEGYCDPSHKQNDDDFATYTGAGFKISSKVFFCDLTYEVLESFFMQAEVPFYQQEGAHVAGLRVSEGEEALYKCLSLFGLLNTQCEGDFMTTNDQIVLALHIAKEDNILYTWVVFAVQLFVDTRRVLGKELNRCFDETQELRKWMVATIKQCLIFGKTNNVNDYYKINSGSVQQVIDGLEILLEKDFMQGVADDYLGARSALYPWGAFYLFRNHPMMLGLLTQHFLTRLHEIGISLGGDQGAIITAIHLYNAVQQSNQLLNPLGWTDLEKVIEWQDPSWTFVGDRPKNPGDCFLHYNLVMGVSVAALSKDRHGKSTLRLHRNRTLPIALNKNRKLKLMSTYANVLLDTNRHGKVGRARWVYTRATQEPLVMLEMLVAKSLKSSSGDGDALTSENKLFSKAENIHPLRMISILKDSLQAEETLLRFDLLTLNERCIEMLRKVQSICVAQSPLDYPPKKYEGDRKMTGCISHMLAGVSGVERYQPTRFQEACAIVEQVVETQGSTEYEKAKARCFVQTVVGPMAIDKFETPPEDNVLLSDRAHLSRFSRIIIGDGSHMTIL